MSLNSGLPVVHHSIKARFKGGDSWYSGKITALNRDGSYAVHYSDGDVETHVARELIEVSLLKLLVELNQI
jgi:hypothetical protein